MPRPERSTISMKAEDLGVRREDVWIWAKKQGVPRESALGQQ